MIDIKDLRIGNLVILGEGDIVKVIAIDSGNPDDAITLEGEDWVESFQQESLTPIPLSPEVLLAAGFELKKDDEYYTCYSFPDGWHICRPNSDIGVSVGYKKGSWYWSSDVHDVEISFLHDLQNLYFAHTRKEIVYNHHPLN